MATLRQIKEKQKSVTAINKITKAMKLVATAKSQMAIKQMKEYEKYFHKIEQIIGEISNDVKKKDKFKGTYWIVIMSDLGLAGGYNINILKELKQNISKNDKILVIGSKGIWFAKSTGNNVAEWFTLSEILEGNQLPEIATRIKKAYYDLDLNVKIIYSKFISQMEFIPDIKTLLPIQKIKIDKKEESLAVTTFEPDKEELLKQMENIYIQSFLVGIYRESQASEHTSRRIAMDSASKNGEDLLNSLNIEYNRERQAKITQEISEIIGGAESLK